MNTSTLEKKKQKPFPESFCKNVFQLWKMGRLECCWDRGMTIKCVIWLAFVRMHLNLAPSSERNSLVFSPNGVEPISMDGLDRPVCWCGWVECRGQFVLMRWLQNKSLLLWEVSFQPPPMQSRVRQILPPVSGFRYINCANQTVSFQCRTRLFRISISQQARGSCNQSPAHKLWEIRSLAQVSFVSTESQGWVLHSLAKAALISDRQRAASRLHTGWAQLQEPSVHRTLGPSPPQWTPSTAL